MKALVLSGGEIKGAWQIGALSEWLKIHPEWEPDYISGTSVGAINAYAIACHMAKGFSFRDAVEGTVAWWSTRVKSGKDIAKKRNWLQLALQFGDWKGYQSMDPLRELLGALGKGVDLKGNRKFPVEVACVNLRSGALVYWDITGYPIQNAIDMVMASAMMPIIMPGQTVLGSPNWYDGGVRDVAPLRGAVTAGATEVLALVTSPWTYYAKKTGSLPQLAGALISAFVDEATDNDLTTCWEINRQVEAGTAQPQHRIIDLKAIRPQAPIHMDIWSFTQQDILTMIQWGRDDVRGWVENHAGG